LCEEGKKTEEMFVISFRIAPSSGEKSIAHHYRRVIRPLPPTPSWCFA